MAKKVAGERGVGQRAHDLTCISLCLKHHAAWHDLRPPFSGMQRERRSEWAREQIRLTRGAFLRDAPPSEEVPW